ncbi:hypothetical protein B0H19DRAFT_1235137 [Mycena capillaripes]|nr:hypothetical protein B0H19DRAFT_1235137 [Mycena capillaripes]
MHLASVDRRLLTAEVRINYQGDTERTGLSNKHPARPSRYDLHHDGLPWEIPLSSIAVAVGRKAVLRQQLLNEGLVTQADLDRCHALAPTKKRLDPKITLYRLLQPFPIAFHRGLHVWVVGDTEVKPWTYTCMFTDSRAQYRPLVRPYTARTLAPLSEHAGTDTVVMRIVKMLAAPVCVLPGYDHTTPMPVEGELVCRLMGRARASRLHSWFCDVPADPSDSAAALRILVEVHPLLLFSSLLAQRRNKATPDDMCRAAFTSPAFVLALTVVDGQHSVLTRPVFALLTGRKQNFPIDSDTHDIRLASSAAVISDRTLGIARSRGCIEKGSGSGLAVKSTSVGNAPLD